MARKKTKAEEPIKTEVEAQPRKKHPGGRPVKWTKEVALDLAGEMLKYFTSHPSAIFLGEFKSRKYTNVYGDLLMELGRKYPEFSETLKKIKGILETRLAKGASTGKLKETFTIFNLKCNYGWQDKMVVEQNTTLTLKGSLAKLLDEKS